MLAFNVVWHKAFRHQIFLLKYPLRLIKIIKSFPSGKSFKLLLVFDKEAYSVQSFTIFSQQILNLIKILAR